MGGSRTADEREAVAAAAAAQRALEEQCMREAAAVGLLEVWLAKAPERAAEAKAAFLSRQVGAAAALAAEQAACAELAAAREDLHAGLLKLRSLQHQWALSGVTLLEAELSLVTREQSVLGSMMRQWEHARRQQLGRRPTDAERANDEGCQRIMQRQAENATRLKSLERRLARAVHKEVAWPGQYWQHRGRTKGESIRPIDGAER